LRILLQEPVLILRLFKVADMANTLQIVREEKLLSLPDAFTKQPRLNLPESAGV
jgi:hypothetical protein